MVKTLDDGDGVNGGAVSKRWGQEKMESAGSKTRAEGGSGLRAFAAFPEYPGCVPRAHMVANNHLELQFLVEEEAPWMVHKHTQGKTFIHIKK